MIEGSYLNRVRSLSPSIAELAAPAEQSRRLPDELVDLMRREQMFALFLPKAFGGLELSWVEALAVLEEVSAADSSAGWCLLKVSSTNQLAGYLEPSVASEIWTDSSIATAGTLNPKGRAERVDGGWRLSGRYDWGSGTTFADWITAGAMLFEPGEDQPIAGPGGATTRVFIFPRKEVSFHDTWHTHGMRGTGSVDFELKDVFIPEQHTFTFPNLEPRQPGELYQSIPFHATMMLPHASLAIGIARAAVNALVDLAGNKTPLMSKSILKDKEWVQECVGRATALLQGGRAYLRQAVNDALQAKQFDSANALSLSLASTHVTHCCVDAVTMMYQAAGGSAVFEASPLQRHFRDVHVAASHFLVNREKYAGAGRVVFGDARSPLPFM